MSASNGEIRKKVQGLVLYTNELYHKSYPGKPTINLIPTAEDNSDFSARLGGTPNAFFRVYKDKDPHLQGMYKSLATGMMSSNDVVYKYAGWSDDYYSGSGVSNVVHGMHTFSASDFSGLRLLIGQEYIYSCEVFVSKTHARNSGYFPVISIKSTDQDGKHYGYYDFSKTGTWQVVSVTFTPSLRSLVKATSGSAGTAGTSGTSGASGVITRTLAHTAYLWPHEGTTSASDRKDGYMLYKNPQLEKGSERTQFTRYEKPRSSLNSLKDLSGNKNSLSVARNTFDSSSLPVFAAGSFANLGITGSASGYSSSFNVGSTTKKTYEFWINLTSATEDISTLLYSDITKGSSKFVSNEALSRRQHIYIEKGKIHCNFYNEFGLVYSAHTTNEEIENATIYNISLSVDMSKSSGNKVKFYVNGNLKPSSAISSLRAPSNLKLNLYPSLSTNDVFANASIVLYKVASFNNDGESQASNEQSIYVGQNRNNFGVRVSWSNVPEASWFIVYRSINNLNFDSDNSLISAFTNPNFGLSATTQVSFEDSGNIPAKHGKPKTKAQFDKYRPGNTNFYDGSNLKLSIGDYPITEKYTVDGSVISQKKNSDGKIYQVSVYNRTLNPNEIKNNYIQFSKNFNTTTNTGNYGFSVSAGNATGGYGGGY